ncbi:MAG: radical SAM protein [Candidatus Kaiserbacteria bacterium]|nr:radical SAM protein [Candidatus Kaiserbacteria bacterium]
MARLVRSVCLIIPPSPFLTDEHVFPFLGPLKVGSMLKDAKWPVKVIDLAGKTDFIRDIENAVSNSESQCFGITATTPQFPAAVQIAKAIHRVRKDARSIIGGTHATLTVAARKYAEERRMVGRAAASYRQLEDNFDVIVSGDGEETIFLATEDNAPKLIDADDRRSPLFLTNEMLDATPFPARDLIDLDSYHYFIDGVRATSLIAQLGCPYNCGFCAGRASSMLRKIRTRSAENIVKEMKFLYQTYGYRGFMFYDDELNLTPKMVDLMKMITQAGCELGVEWKLRGFIKSERFNDEQAQVMFEAGFREILIGFESGSPRILKNIQKGATLDDNTRCMEIADRRGLKVKALMSLGHPGESEETIELTLNWLLKVKPAAFDATVITPYPGSPYYDDALPVPVVDGENPVWVYSAKNGDRLYQEAVDYAKTADYYKGNPNEDDGYVSHVWTDFIDARTLVLRRNELEKTVRAKLDIPLTPSRPGEVYERSMGQSPPLIPS